MSDPSDYELIRDCWISGQIEASDMQQRLNEDPEFKAWFLERVT